MQYIYGTTELCRSKDCVVVLGNFDGVHKGHQRLFSIAKEEAKKHCVETVVFSFYPHPTWVIGNQPKPLIMSRRDKKQMIKEQGIDVLIEYPFTSSFAEVSPKDFFVNILLRQLQAKVLVIGSNYHFGKDKAGTPDYLCELGKEFGVEVRVVEAIKSGGYTVSSSIIRGLIQEGQIEQANELMGHPYMIVGNVVQGKRLGRTLGFPTINIIADPDRVYPPNGVYATYVKVYDSLHLGMTNIGYNPTVNGQKKMIETHILDISETLYGEAVTLYFYHHLRPEQKFQNVEHLKSQLEEDRLAVKHFFEIQSNLFAIKE